MKNKFIVTSILLVLLLVIGGVILFYEKPKIDQEEKNMMILDTVDHGDIVAIQYVPRNDTPFKIASDLTHGIYLTEPYRYPLDMTKANNIFSSLKDLKISDYIADEVTDKALYGLQDPYTAITISYSDGKSQVINIGDESFDRSKYYVEKNDNGRIGYVSKADMDSYLVSLDEIKDKKIINKNATELKGIAYNNGEKSVSLIKNQDNWEFAGNVDENVNTEKVNEFKNKLFNLKVDSFYSRADEASASSFDEADITLDLGFSSGDYQMKAISNGDNKYQVYSTFDGVESASNTILGPEDFILSVDKVSFDSIFFPETDYVKTEDGTNATSLVVE